MNDSRFELDKQWRSLRGLAFGLQQPVLIGRASVGRLTTDDLQRLEERARMSPGIQLLPFDPRADLAHRFVFRLLDWIGALQRLAKVPVSERVHVLVQGRSATRPDHLVMQLALPAPQAKAARAAIQWATAQLPWVLGGSTPPDGPASLSPEGLQTQLKPLGEAGLNRFHILQAAHRLDIPTFPLTSRVTAFGSGDCLRLMTSTTTDRTPSIGVSIAASKSQTATVLRLAGLPGTQHLAAHSAEEAVAAAERLGYPVVVKPDDQERGVGVQANLVRPEQVSEAWTAARKVSERVLVERWVDGSTHRLTVFNGCVIRVVQRMAGGVTGDGVHTVRDLVDHEAQEVLARTLPGLQGARAVTLDEEALGMLQQAGLNPSDVPGPGARVRLRRRDNINAGGRNVELPLDVVHPDNLGLAIAAAAQLHLDFAGIDLISVDITQSWIDNGARICEVNAMPQLGVGGDPRIYEKLMPELMGGRFRIPVQVVLCRADPASRAQALQDCLHRHRDASVSDMAGLWHLGQRVSSAFEHGFEAARALLLRPNVATAVCLLSADEIVASGFPVNGVDQLRVAQAESHSVAEQAQVAQARLMLPVRVSGEQPARMAR